MNAYKNYPNASTHEKHLQVVFLRNENLTTKEIAEITGFSGASYMAETFKKFYKMSPRDFRKSTK